VVGRAVSHWENKYVIGLTGNIATGKSTVRKMLQQLGAYTIARTMA
jgi:dephospho-CoA kinase